MDFEYCNRRERLVQTMSELGKIFSAAMAWVIIGICIAMSMGIVAATTGALCLALGTLFEHTILNVR